jgi:hypothetical protein
MLTATWVTIQWEALRHDVLAALHRQYAPREIDVGQVQREDIPGAETVDRHQKQHRAVSKFDDLFDRMSIAELEGYVCCRNGSLERWAQHDFMVEQNHSSDPAG